MVRAGDRRKWLVATVGALLAAACMAAPKHTRDTPHFHFVYDADQVIDVEAIQQTAEAAYRHISGLLGYAPTERIPVILYAKRAEFLREAQQKRTELVVGTASSEDTIRLDASRVFENPNRVIGHEVAHVILFRMLGPHAAAMPLWMNEGIAQEAGGADAEGAHNRVVTALLENRLIPLTKLAHSFPAGDDVGLAYDEGQDAVNVLLDHGGWQGLRDFAGRLASGQSLDDAMSACYGASAAEWAGRWRSELSRGARSRVYLQWAQWVIPGAFLVALALGVLAVRAHRRRQIREEEPPSDIAPPSWWHEDEFRR